MLEAATGYLGELLLDAALGREQTPPGNADPDHAPHGIYPCAGEDRWIALAVDSDESWRRLAAVSRREVLADAAFDRHDDRLANAEKLDEAIAAWTRNEQAEDLMERLQAAGIAASVVRFTPEVMACCHLEQRGWFRGIEHPDMGEHRYNGHPWRFAGLPERSDSPPPRLGEHSREVLRERLGLPDDEIDALFERGVTGAVLT
jgi:benzylsuccinate CoA-transferase BbsF subunit